MNHQVNAFADLHVAFGETSAPGHRRLGNPWTRVAEAIDPLWLGTATSVMAAPVQQVAGPGWTVWAVGDVFSYRGDERTPLATFVADLADDRAAPALLDAHAAVFGWHEASRRLHVWTDRMGTLHVYLGGAPGRVAVGTCLAAVAEAARPALDWVGITGFCGFGFYPADRTMYEDVRILRPATCTVFDVTGAVISQSRYWDWSFDPVTGRSDDDLVDEFADIWGRTIKVQLGEQDVVVPISGGLDSRTVLAAAAPVGSSPGDGVRAFTYGYTPSSPEIRIARRVARARGLSAEEFVVAPYLLDRIVEVAEAVEGFQSVSMSRQAGISGPLAGMGQRVVGGHWGDVWFDRAGAPGSGDLVDAAYRKFAKRGRAWLLDHLCAPHLGGEDPEAILRALLAEELARLPDLGDRDVTLTALKTEQWSFRWTLASVRAYQLGLPTLLPFYANEVVDYFLRVPPSQLEGRRLQIAYLRRHHPDLAAITWQDTDQSLFTRPWEPAAALARRAGRKALRVASRRPAIQRNWEVQYLAGAGPARMRELLAEGGLVELGLLTPTDVAALCEGFRVTPDAGSGYTVDALVTLGCLAPPAWPARR